MDQDGPRLDIDHHHMPPPPAPAPAPSSLTQETISESSSIRSNMPPSAPISMPSPTKSHFAAPFNPSMTPPDFLEQLEDFPSLEMRSYQPSSLPVIVDDRVSRLDDFHAMPPPPPSLARSYSRSPSPAKLARLEPYSHSPYLLPTSQFRSLSPARAGSPVRQPSPVIASQPFDFSSTALLSTPKTSQRKGHRYKQSSVSINFYPDAPVRAPLPVPLSRPIPNFKECVESCTKDQKLRFLWCLLHSLIALECFWYGTGSLALTTLSHLVFYDAISAFLSTLVDIFGNFEAWKLSSIRHPFGLERIEVLAGIAMSVILAFIGTDVFSHAIQGLIASDDHGHGHSHHSHLTPAITYKAMDASVFAALIATVMSALVLQNHSRIGRAVRFLPVHSLEKSHDSKPPIPERVANMLTNPAHFLTLSCCCAVFLLSALPKSWFSAADKTLALIMCVCMFVSGSVFTIALCRIILMASPDPGKVTSALEQIGKLPEVQSISKLRSWRVNYRLFIVSMSLEVTCDVEEYDALRKRVLDIVEHTIMKNNEGATSETTIDITPAD
ncbi:hypothetical protein CANCADRAFT_30000 [Tortispora caseinolytica NRRL Y-17796]|uniref:Zinc transporter n=1 Tax=Tortispora caseinolytica NRRL Y-17796 TaxID=767744 RepID=A0A1E4TIP1_9ASCO|nr:hypothetical protein CANCADRAFT_30000 [Tortispora caseinolytica NRRL Y-17796]